MIILKGQPRTKKNSQNICMTKSGRRFVSQSKLYKDYEISCLQQLLLQRQEFKNLPEGPYNVKCIYYRGDKRKVDLVNLIEATNDILVRGGVFEDDNHTIIASHDGSRVFYDKENPRVEIEISIAEY